MMFFKCFNRLGAIAISHNFSSITCSDLVLRSKAIVLFSSNFIKLGTTICRFIYFYLLNLTEHPWHFSSSTLIDHLKLFETKFSVLPCSQIHTWYLNLFVLQCGPQSNLPKNNWNYMTLKFRNRKLNENTAT